MSNIAVICFQHKASVARVWSAVHQGSCYRKFLSYISRKIFTPFESFKFWTSALLDSVNRDNGILRASVFLEVVVRIDTKFYSTLSDDRLLCNVFFISYFFHYFNFWICMNVLSFNTEVYSEKRFKWILLWNRQTNAVAKIWGHFWAGYLQRSLRFWKFSILNFWRILVFLNMGGRVRGKKFSFPKRPSKCRHQNSLTFPIRGSKKSNFHILNFTFLAIFFTQNMQKYMGISVSSDLFSETLSKYSHKTSSTLLERVSTRTWNINFSRPATQKKNTLYQSPTQIVIK